MSSRFVILHHRFDDGEHWDLMLEQGEVLFTWQLLCDPTDPANYPIPGRRIGKHRKFYLTYEGPLTRSRGTVRRVDSGSLEITEDTARGLRIVLTGMRLHGSFSILNVGDEWVFDVSDAGSPKAGVP